MARDPYDMGLHFKYHEDLGIYDINDDNGFISDLKKLTYWKVISYNKDLLDQISYTNYKTELLWWVIMLYNDIIDPLNITTDKIFLPSLSDIENLLVERAQSRIT